MSIPFLQVTVVQPKTLNCIYGLAMMKALYSNPFQQDNLCYVNEYTHELVPVNEVVHEAKEPAESCGYVGTVVTRESKRLKG